jgi:hypothetical protein
MVARSSPVCGRVFRPSDRSLTGIYAKTGGSQRRGRPEVTRSPFPILRSGRDLPRVPRPTTRAPTTERDMAVVDSLVVFAVSLLLGSLGIHPGALVVTGVRDTSQAVGTAVIGAIVWVVGATLGGWIPFSGQCWSRGVRRRHHVVLSPRLARGRRHYTGRLDRLAGSAIGPRQGRDDLVRSPRRPGCDHHLFFVGCACGESLLEKRGRKIPDRSRRSRPANPRLTSLVAVC